MERHRRALEKNKKAGRFYYGCVVYDFVHSVLALLCPLNSIKSLLIPLTRNKKLSHHQRVAISVQVIYFNSGVGG
jgi:hypothetical protein